MARKESKSAGSGARRGTEEELRELRERLRTLTDEAAKNEVILRKTQERELDLLRAESLPALLSVMVTGLGDSYTLDAVTLVLVDPQHEIRHLLIGGGQRLDDYDLLVKRIEEHQLPREAFEWYLDLRRFGSVPHAGFGMGIERVVAWICGLEHLRFLKSGDVVELEVEGIGILRNRVL